MHDFLLNKEDREFRQEIKEFFGRELAPRASSIEDREDWQTIKDVVATLGGAGYLRLMFRDLYSGPVSRPGLTHATIVSEEASYINYAFETTIGTSLSSAYPLHRHASAAVRERHLISILNGTHIGAICVTEQNVGSDSAGMETRIVFDPTRREFIINGFKRYISNASVADVYIVYGITNQDVPAKEGMTALVVPAGTCGMNFPRLYRFMGRRGCVVGEVEFRDCRVPEENLLGNVDEGFRIMLGMFNFERVILAGSGLGVARSAFDIATSHAQSRKTFGEALGCKQLIWSKVAQMSCQIDAAELVTHRAAKMYDAGISGKDLMKQAAMAKLLSTEAAKSCVDQTVQILGGDGLTKEYGRAEQIYRDARALTIVGGTSEMAQYLIASRDLPQLKLKL